MPPIFHTSKICYAFQWPFKDILVKEEKSHWGWTDDYLLWFRLVFVFFVFSSVK